MLYQNAALFQNSKKIFMFFLYHLITLFIFPFKSIKIDKLINLNIFSLLIDWINLILLKKKEKILFKKILSAII